MTAFIVSLLCLAIIITIALLITYLFAPEISAGQALAFRSLARLAMSLLIIAAALGLGQAVIERVTFG